MKLILNISPHIHNKRNAANIMYTVIISLIPVILASIYFFRLNAVRLIATCVTGTLLTELIFQKLSGKKVTIIDGSAAITGILLALTLPPGLPAWMAFAGSIFAIAIGKQIFGGLGCNIFNPALLGRAFLMASFPLQMTTWIEPFSVDTVSKATPLALIKSAVPAELPAKLDLLFGNVSGAIGGTSVIAIIIGGLLLYLTHTIDWRIPLGYIGAVFCLTALPWLVNPDKFSNPLYHVLAGGLMLGSIFMATDPVTTPVTKKGRWIFGIGCGIILVIIRLKGNLIDGTMYSILIMNALAPVINKITAPRVFGYVPK